ncbi:MAG: PIG-L deacetylase family protein [Pyrinomonadaceae bacterium]
MNALILVAHADDETLGAGGTIRKLVTRRWDVAVVVLSDGIVRARGEEQDNRPDAIAACHRLGAAEPRFLGFPDQRFDTVPMMDLAGTVMQLNLLPDLIITHVDTDLNMDHRLTCEVAKIIGRPRSKPVAILGCEIPNTTFWNGRPFPVNYYVDITQEIETKIEAFSQYRNECQAYPHPWSREGLSLLAKYHGLQSGLPMAEAFHVIRGYEGRMPT